MNNTIEINGEIYSKTNQDYTTQIDRVQSQIGDSMEKALVDAKAYIAGGAILSAFTLAPIKDIDVYFPSRESLAQAFLSVTENWQNIYLSHTDKSITLKDGETGAIVQFIYFKYFETAEDIFKSFDFTVCMGALDMEKNLLVFTEDFISDVASRTLHFNPKTAYPYISLLRTRKYQEKGFNASRGLMLAIALACSQKLINSWSSAKEQLGGVYGNEVDIKIEKDCAFSFEEFYELLKNIPEKTSFTNNCDYDSLFLELIGIEYSNYIAQKNKK